MKKSRIMKPVSIAIATGVVMSTGVAVPYVHAAPHNEVQAEAAQETKDVTVDLKIIDVDGKAVGSKFDYNNSEPHDYMYEISVHAGNSVKDGDKFTVTLDNGSNIFIKNNAATVSNKTLTKNEGSSIVPLFDSNNNNIGSAETDVDKNGKAHITFTFKNVENKDNVNGKVSQTFLVESPGDKPQEHPLIYKYGDKTKKSNYTITGRNIQEEKPTENTVHFNGTMEVEAVDLDNNESFLYSVAKVAGMPATDPKTTVHFKLDQKMDTKNEREVRFDTETKDSIKNMPYRDFHVYRVDNKSPDNKKKLVKGTDYTVEKVNDNYYKVVLNENKMGT